MAVRASIGPRAASSPATTEAAGTLRGKAADPVEPFSVRPMRERDIAAVIELMRSIEEAAFLEWEDLDLLGAHLKRPGTANYVALDADTIVGAAIGGSIGVRGSINHIAVCPSHRRRGIGSALVREQLAAFRRQGLRRVFLFVASANRSAQALWRGCGFLEIHQEATWECDL